MSGTAPALLGRLRFIIIAMRTSKVIHVVSCHAEGEVGDVIVGGVGPVPGDTLWDQLEFIASDEELRNFVLNEPRGGVFRHMNLLVPPRDSRADAAFLIMEAEDNPPMSGSNAMCVATVLLNTGILPITGKQTKVVLETPAGLVEAVAECEDGQARRIRLRNVASFADRLEAPLEVAGLGTFKVDTAFGGDSYVLIEAADLGFSLVPDEAADLAAVGSAITDAANEQLGFSHPQIPWNHLSFCQFTGPLTGTASGIEGTNTVVIKPAKLDRSPCGTGSSARMAVLYAKGVLNVGGTYASKSIIGSRFDCQILESARIGDKEGIIPSLCGRAWITGTHQYMLDPLDPWPGGYRLSDTWPRPSGGHRADGAQSALPRKSGPPSRAGRPEIRAPLISSLSIDGSIEPAVGAKAQT